MGKVKDMQVVYYYLNNVARTSLPVGDKRNITCWVEGYGVDLFGINLQYAWYNAGRLTYRHERKRYWASLKSYIDEKDGLASSVKNVRAMLAPKEIVDIAAVGYDKYIDAIFDAFKVSPLSRPILRYMINCEAIPMLGDFHSSLMCHGLVRIKDHRIFSMITGASIPTVEKTFARDGELFTKGFIKIDSDGDVCLSDPCKRIVRAKTSSIQKIRELALGKPLAASLTREHFNYIADDYDHIRTLLSNAVKVRAHGVNILIYGEPGTGKTEFCKAIVNDIGAGLYELSSRENSKSDRISQISVAQTLFANEKNTILMFDEAEDAFTRDVFARDDNSKLHFNRMLEKNITPMVWITNRVDRIDPAHIRRFTYALEAKKPDNAAKEKIWKNICVKHKVKLSNDSIAEYAHGYDVAPSFIDTAVGAAKLAKSNAAIEKTIKALVKATTGAAPAKKNANEICFEPALLNTDVDLTTLVNKIIDNGKQNFSLCLYGAPGTGKSAFARYLADKMGLNVSQKRASDIMSCWVGETEKNIARAFEMARETRSMLVFDEADSFLRSREMAQRSWEISQVNEMLTQMESHPYPFVCTTNLMRDLDEASLRRFMFKVKYDFMKPSQIQLAFKKFFDINIDDKTSLSHLSHLTPGDFAVVRGKSDFLDISDIGELIKMLESEQRVKGVKSVKMGFA